MAKVLSSMYYITPSSFHVTLEGYRSFKQFYLYALPLKSKGVKNNSLLSNNAQLKTNLRIWDMRTKQLIIERQNSMYSASAIRPLTLSSLLISTEPAKRHLTILKLLVSTTRTDFNLLDNLVESRIVLFRIPRSQ